MAFNVEVPIEELKKNSLFVAVPMYGGENQGLFCDSIAELTKLCALYGIEMRRYFLFNESLITRGRNYCADAFMRSGFTHMLFIDADIHFNPNDVIAMLAIAHSDTKYDVLCGPYPKKSISWEKVAMAVNKGAADDDANNLERYVGDYVFSPVEGKEEIRLDEPVEVLESGTGFMLIQRSVFERFEEAYPWQKYRPDHVRSEDFDGSREITAFFDTPIDNKFANLYNELEAFIKENPDAYAIELKDFLYSDKSMFKYSNRYLSEDYMFCQWARKIGIKVWLCPWIQLKHIGMMIFGGSLADLAQIGAVATADTSQIKKRKI